MKLILVLTFIALVACSEVIGNHQLQSKHCKDNELKTNNWVIKIGNNWLIYNNEKNCVGILNKSLNMIFVIDGSGFMFMFNYQSGSGILASLTTHFGSYIADLPKFNFNPNKDFISICEIIAQNKGLLSDSIDITTGNFFDFEELIKHTMISNDVDGFFTNRADLSSKIKESFSVIINKLNIGFVNGSIDYSKWCFIACITPFLDTELQDSMMQFFLPVALNLRGIFNIELFNILQTILNGDNIDIELSNLCKVLNSVGPIFNTLDEAIVKYKAGVIPITTNELKPHGNLTYRIITNILGNMGSIEIRGTGTMAKQIVIVFNITDKFVAFYSRNARYLYIVTSNLMFAQSIYSLEHGVGIAINALGRGQSFNTKSAEILGNFRSRQYSLGSKTIYNVVELLTPNLTSQIAVSNLLQRHLSNNQLTTQFKGLIDTIKVIGYKTELMGLNVLPAIFKMIEIKLDVSTSFAVSLQTAFASDSASIYLTKILPLLKF